MRNPPLASARYLPSRRILPRAMPRTATTPHEAFPLFTILRMFHVKHSCGMTQHDAAKKRAFRSPALPLSVTSRQKQKRPMLSRSPSRCCARISSRDRRTLTRCPRTATFPSQLPRSPRDRRITRTVATLPARPPLRSPFPTRPPRGCRITRTSTALPARLPHPIASHPPSPSPSHS